LFGWLFLNNLLKLTNSISKCLCNFWKLELSQKRCSLLDQVNSLTISQLLMVIFNFRLFWGDDCKITCFSPLITFNYGIVIFWSIKDSGNFVVKIWKLWFVLLFVETWNCRKFQINEMNLFINAFLILFMSRFTCPYLCLFFLLNSYFLTICVIDQFLSFASNGWIIYDFIRKKQIPLYCIFRS
jgi:hypothetical protein